MCTKNPIFVVMHSHILVGELRKRIFLRSTLTLCSCFQTSSLYPDHFPLKIPPSSFIEKSGLKNWPLSRLSNLLWDHLFLCYTNSLKPFSKPSFSMQRYQLFITKHTFQLSFCSIRWDNLDLFTERSKIFPQSPISIYASNKGSHPHTF